jgi:excisionase family DNA binding protein
MSEIRLSKAEVDAFKREMLEGSVLVTVETAANVLSVHPRTVYRMIEEARLTPYRRSRSDVKGTRILASELKTFVASMRG